MDDSTVADVRIYLIEHLCELAGALEAFEHDDHAEMVEYMNDLKKSWDRLWTRWEKDR